MRTQAATVLALALAASLPACAEMPSAKAPMSPGQPASTEGMSYHGGMPVAREERDGDGMADDRSSDRRLAQNVPAPAKPAPGAPPPPPPGDGPRRDAGGEVAQMRGPMLIYSAQISMAVFEVNAGLARVEALGRELGGFLAKRDDRSVTIRVPAQRFDEAVRAIEGFGDMLHRNVSAQDVTEEFRDLEIRLASARAVQKRLSELLAKAAKVEESLAIERELDRVSGEIERVEGRMKFLRDRAVFSTITVTFEAKPKEQVGGSQVRLPVPWLHDLGLRRLLSL